MEVRGVDGDGSAILLRVWGFRPHFYFGPLLLSGSSTEVDDLATRLRREIPSASMRVVKRWRLCGYAREPTSVLRVDHALDESQAAVVDAAKKLNFDGEPIEEGLAPVRRFLMEADASGGSWLEARNARKTSDGVFDCSFADLRGSAPDILGGEAPVAPLPPLTTLFLRFEFTSGYDDASFWCDGDESSARAAADDSLRLAVLRVVAKNGQTTDLVHGCCCDDGKKDPATSLELHRNETDLVRAVAAAILRVDPDVLVVYDNRTLGLFLERYERCTKSKLVLDRFPGGPPTKANNFARVGSVTTYSKDWIRSRTETRMASSNNLETHRLRGCAGRLSIDALRFVLMRSSPKLTSHDFREAVGAVLGQDEVPPFFKPAARAALALKDAALLATAECRLLAEMAKRLKMVAEIVEFARVVGLDLDTIHWQAASIRTDQLLLKAARKLQVAMPLHNVQPAAVFKKGWAADTTPYLYHPAPWSDLQDRQRHLIDVGLQGHSSDREPFLRHGTAGFYGDPVAVLDFASLYPSIFIAHNVCYSTLRLESPKDGPETKDDSRDHRSPQSVDTTFSHSFVPDDERRGVLPRLLEALMRERKAAKAGAKAALQRGDAAAADCFDARQLSLKMCANATYGYTGSSVSSLEGKPLAESCLRWGNFYCREARRLIEEEDPTRRVIYAQTDSLFVLLPGRDYMSAVDEGQKMANLVTRTLPDPLKLEYQRVLQPFLLTQVNRYAGGEVVVDDDGNVVKKSRRRSLHRKGLGAERGSASFVRRVVRECLDAALVRESVDLAKARAVAAVDALVGGRVDVGELTLGAFLWRVDHDDLERMRRHAPGRKRPKEDVDALKTSHVALAVRDLAREPRRRYRLGEFVPEVVAFRSGSTSSTQCDNVENPDVVLQNNVPVDLKLYLEKKLKPDLTRLFLLLIGDDRNAKAKVSELLAARRATNGLLRCDDATWLLGGESVSDSSSHYSRDDDEEATTPQKKKTRGVDVRRHFASPRRRPAEPPTKEAYLDALARRNEAERRCGALFAERRRRAARVFGLNCGAAEKTADLAAPLANELRILRDLEAKLDDLASFGGEVPTTPTTVPKKKRARRDDVEEAVTTAAQTAQTPPSRQRRDKKTPGSDDDATSPPTVVKRPATTPPKKSRYYAEPPDLLLSEKNRPSDEVFFPGPPGSASEEPPPMVTDGESWACHACTYEHAASQAEYLQCALCGTERK